MNQADLEKLDAIKRNAAAQHEAKKRELLRRIADALLSAPDVAFELAKRALLNRTEPWQQWSRSAWEEILRTWSPEEVAQILTAPKDVHQELLADCQPFCGLRETLKRRNAK